MCDCGNPAHVPEVKDAPIKLVGTVPAKFAITGNTNPAQPFKATRDSTASIVGRVPST